MRVQENITSIIREELDAIGCQYMSAPLLHPLDLWAESGRSEGQSFGLLKVRDRNAREFVLSGTGEEMFVDVMRHFDISYKDLPVCLYQLSTKFRDEARARFGLWRCREFLRNAVTGGDTANEDRVAVNYGRDYEVDVLADIASAQAGFLSPDGGVYQMHRGVEVGNTFILGTHYSERMKGAAYTASDGSKKPYYMGCYGIGVGRTMQTIAELSHDDRGLLWGHNIAPFQIHFISMLNDAVTGEALRALHARGLSVLEDDRNESMGVKFADGELYGIPLRLVHSKRSMSAGGIEWHNRITGESGIWPLGEVAERASLALGS